jgi:SAM-dependent methyltransferase
MINGKVLAKNLRLVRTFGLRTVAVGLSHQVTCKVRGLDFSSESLEEIGITADLGRRHDASGFIGLTDVFRTFGLAGRIQSVMDVGCGKGAALVAFSQLGVRTLGGIDISERLVDICRRNLEKCNVRAELRRGDARSFDGFERYELFYLFNSFPRDVLVSFLDNLSRYCNRTNSSRLILFRNPQDEDLLLQQPFKIVAADDKHIRCLLVTVQPTLSST